MRILIISSGNIVQLAKYPRYFARQGHSCTFINPIWRNALCERTEKDEFGELNIKFYTQAEFARRWQTEKFDCIFGTQHGIAHLVFKYQELMKIPALLQILDIADEKLVSQWRKQTVFREVLPNIQYLTGINPAIVEQCSKNFGRNDCECVFYPIDTELFDSVPEQKTEDSVLIVSRDAHYKRIDLAIGACAYAGKKLIIAGSRDESGISYRARKLGIKVEFKGVVQDKEKAVLMKKCKLHIFTQMWAEAPCIPSAEALYCKKPSIIFDYPAQRTIEGNFSYYVTPGNWKEMGKRIQWVYNNYDEAKELAKNGHKWVRDNLNSDVIAGQILNRLTEMVG